MSRRVLGAGVAPFVAILAMFFAMPAMALAANSISGTVTDNNTGDPVAAISATLETSDGTTCTPTAVTTTTGTDGTYTLTPAADGSNFVVEFNRGGANPDWNDVFDNGATSCSGATILDTTGGDVTDVNTQLTNNTGSVSGTVTDATDNQPIKGITVEVTNAQGSSLGTATTGADGTYTITSVESGSDTITFNRDNDADFNAPSVTQTVAPGSTATTVNQALTPLSGHITGTVTAGGSPVPNERVILLDSNGDATGNDTTTDTAGFFTLTDVPAGTYGVQFQPAPGQNLVPQYFNGKSGYGSADPVTVTTNVTTPNINAALAQGGTITGTITDQQTGAPVGNAQVRVLGCETQNCIAATANAGPTTGQFTLTGLPTGTKYLEVFAGGTSYLSPQYFTSQGPQGSPNGISVTAGQTTTANDVLLVGGTITGKLTGPGGAPIVGEEVEAVSANGEFFDPVTDATGTYTVTGLPTGTYKLEFFGNSAFVSEYLGGTESSATATPISVTQGQTVANVNASLPAASAGGRIAGTVTGPGGSPLQGASVTLYDSAGHQLDLPGNFVGTDQDGTYKTPPLLPGSYKVMFASGSGNLGFQYYNQQTTLTAANAVGIAAGATTAGINGSLSAGGSIGGTVTDASTHQPISGITVDVLSAGGEVLGQAGTAPDGTYTVSGLPAGNAYHVEFDPRGVAIKGGNGILYAPQFWNNKTTLAGSDAVTVATGAKTANIGAALGAVSSVPSVTPTPTPTPTPKPKPVAGKPKTSGAKLSGLGKGKVSLKFTLAAGNNGAPKLKSFTVKLPKGLSFIKKGLKKGVSIKGGGKFTDKLSKGALVVTLKGTASKLSVSLNSKAIKISKSLQKSAKKHKIKSLTVTVTASDQKKKKTTSKLTFKKPK